MIRNAPKTGRKASIPSAGAGTQVYLGAGVNPGTRRTPAGGDRRSAVDPLAGKRFGRYVQRDPEGGLRELHVYNINGQRVVRSFARKKALGSKAQAALKPASASSAEIAATQRPGASGRGVLSAHAAGKAPSQAAVRAAQRMLDRQPSPRSGSRSKNPRRRLYERAVGG